MLYPARNKLLNIKKKMFENSMILLHRAVANAKRKETVDDSTFLKQQQPIRKNRDVKQLLNEMVQITQSDLEFDKKEEEIAKKNMLLEEIKNETLLNDIDENQKIKKLVDIYQSEKPILNYLMTKKTTPEIETIKNLQDAFAQLDLNDPIDNLAVQKAESIFSNAMKTDSIRSVSDAAKALQHIIKSRSKSPSAKRFDDDSPAESLRPFNIIDIYADSRDTETDEAEKIIIDELTTTRDALIKLIDYPFENAVKNNTYNKKYMSTKNIKSKASHIWNAYPIIENDVNREILTKNEEDDLSYLVKLDNKKEIDTAELLNMSKFLIEMRNKLIENIDMFLDKDELYNEIKDNLTKNVNDLITDKDELYTELHGKLAKNVDDVIADKETEKKPQLANGKAKGKREKNDYYVIKFK